MTDFAARRTMMVDTQVRPSDVTKFPIIEAMLDVAREDFVPAAKRETAYMGDNIDLGGGRVVLDPRTMSKMLDALDISGDEARLQTVLETRRLSGPEDSRDIRATTIHTLKKHKGEWKLYQQDLKSMKYID